eukprot:jgi/Galph1/6022/GphlegSOOS_G4687.1
MTTTTTSGASLSTEVLLVEARNKKKSFLESILPLRRKESGRKLVQQKLDDLRPSLCLEEEKGLQLVAKLPPRVITQYCESMDILRLEALVHAASDLLAQKQKECRLQQSMKHATEDECRRYRENLFQIASIVKNLLSSYGIKTTAHNLEAWRSGDALGKGASIDSGCSFYDRDESIDWSQPCFDRLRACLEEVISICKNSLSVTSVKGLNDPNLEQNNEYVSEVSSLTSSSTLPVKKEKKYGYNSDPLESSAFTWSSQYHGRMSASVKDHAMTDMDSLRNNHMRSFTASKMTPLTQEDLKMVERTNDREAKDCRSQCPSSQSSRYQSSYKSYGSSKSALRTKMPSPDVLLYGRGRRKEENEEYSEPSELLPEGSTSVSGRQDNSLTSTFHDASTSIGTSWDYYMATNTV